MEKKRLRPGRTAGAAAPGRRPVPTQKEKTLRAFRVYVELMDTAAWLRSWMRGPLESFDLTPQGFRLLLLLYEDGPTRAMEVARRMRFRRQNLDTVLGRLEERGWVKRTTTTVPKSTEEPRWLKRRLLSAKRSWGIGVVGLTPQGEKFIGRVLPRQAKVAKSLMRALHGREQIILVEICRKLRAGSILKFMSEITHVDEWDRGERAATDEGAREAQEADEGWDEPAQRRPKKDGLARVLDARMEERRKEEAAQARRAKENEESRLKAELMAILKGIVAKMREYNVLKGAKNVDWDKPPDEEREAGHVVRKLMNLGNDRERELLERMSRKVGNLELVRVLRAMSGE